MRLHHHIDPYRLPESLRPVADAVAAALAEAVARERRIERARLDFWRRPPRTLREAAVQGWRLWPHPRPHGVLVLSEEAARRFVSAGWQRLPFEGLGTLLEPPEAGR